MGRKVGTSLGEIVAAAAAIADREGLAAVTLAAVAADVGVRSPSLYAHVAGLPGLRRQLALHAAGLMTETFEAAVADGEGLDRLRRLGHAYRRFAVTHPGLYDAMLPAPRPGEDDEAYAALARPVAVVTAVLADAGVTGDDAIHATRALRAMVHGFVDSELKGGFGMPTDVDESFDRAVDLVVDGLVVGAPRTQARAQ